MATIVTRAGKGSPLTNAEVDANFTNLDTSKLELSGGTLTGFLTLHANPTQALHASTKEYVDNLATGFKTAPQVRAATTTNLAANYDNGTAGVGATLTADTNRVFTTLDGVTGWAIGNGILVKNQTDAYANGRYILTDVGSVSTPWVLTRCSLCDESSEIPGKYFFVTGGTVNIDTGWVSSVADPDTFVVGTDAISFYQFSGAGAYTAGTGLTLTGNQFAMAADQLLASQTGNSGKYLTTNGTSASWATIDLSAYQTVLVSGTSIKTVNSESLLGSGNITVQAELVSGTNIKTVNSSSILGSGNLTVTDSSKLPLAGGTMTGAITFAGGQTWPTFNQNTTGSSGSCTGNAATATNSNSASAKWTSAAIAGSTTSGGVVSAEFRNNGGTGDANVAAIGFHCTGSYAIHMHLRADGYFGLGGWSRGAWSWYSDPSGNMVAAGNVTAYSDEKLKKNWRDLSDDFVSQLANVKHGIYDRIDEDIAQVGVSAQSLQKIMPEAVVMGLDDTLTVAYGNAAMVSAVQLAKRLVALEAVVAKLVD